MGAEDRLLILAIAEDDKGVCKEKGRGNSAPFFAAFELPDWTYLTWNVVVDSGLPSETTSSV